MTKKSPNQVIEVRVSLQDKQSQQLDAIIGAYQVDKVSESIDQMLSFENFYIGITLLEIATGKEILFGTPNDIGDIINGVRPWALGFHQETDRESSADPCPGGSHRADSHPLPADSRNRPVNRTGVHERGATLGPGIRRQSVPSWVSLGRPTVCARSLIGAFTPTLKGHNFSMLGIFSPFSIAVMTL